MIIRCVTAAAITSGGPAQTISVGSGAGSTLLPKAAIYELTSTTTLDAGGTHRRHGIGITDGTSQRCVGVMAESGQFAVAADAGTRQNNAAVIDFPLTTSEAVDGVAAWSSWQTGGSEITWSNFPATAAQIKATYLFGEDIECKVLEFKYVGATGGEQTISGVGFQPNFAFAITYGDGRSAFGASSGAANLDYSFGYAVHNPLDESTDPEIPHAADPDRVLQWCYSDLVADRFLNSGTTRAAIDSFVCPFIDIAGIGSYQPVSLNRFTSDGAVLEDVSGSEDRHISILFVRFQNHRLFAGAGISPSDAGPEDVVVANPGFLPEAYFICGTAQEAVNGTGDTSGTDVGKVSHGVYTGAESVYVSGTSDDQASTSATLSVTGDNYVFRVVTSAGADFFAATHVSLDADGFTINATGSTLGTTAPVFFYVAIGGSQLITSDSETIVDQAVLTGSAPAQSDTETITDQTVLSATGNLAFDDTEDLLDQHAFALDIAHSDTEEISENVILIALAADALLIVVSDSVTVDDRFVFSGTGSLVFSDTVEIEDRGNLAGDALIVVSDSETITENEQHYLGNVIVVSDTETITDELSTPITATQTKGTQRGTSFQGGAEEGQVFEGGAERGTVL